MDEFVLFSMLKFNVFIWGLLCNVAVRKVVLLNRCLIHLFVFSYQYCIGIKVYVLEEVYFTKMYSTSTVFKQDSCFDSKLFHKQFILLTLFVLERPVRRQLCHYLIVPERPVGRQITVICIIDLVSKIFGCLTSPGLVFTFSARLYTHLTLYLVKTFHFVQEYN